METIGLLVGEELGYVLAIGSFTSFLPGALEEPVNTTIGAGVLGVVVL